MARSLRPSLCRVSGLGRDGAFVLGRRLHRGQGRSHKSCSRHPRLLANQGFLNWLPSPLPSPGGRGRETRAERSDDPCVDFTPFWPCREAQGVGRARSAACALRALTRCRCLREENAVNEASSAAPPPDRASQAARSEAKGHGQWGRLSLPTFFAETKKVGRPPGRTPGQPRIQHPTPLAKIQHKERRKK